MCGKFEVLTLDEVRGIITAVQYQSPLTPIPDWPARFPSVTPGDEISVIVPAPGSKLGVKKLVWGYNAPWDNRRGLAFNTRIERASEDTMWTSGFQSGRILVASPAFYESDSNHKPHRFANEDEAIPLLMAGIAEGDRFSLVTRAADDTVSPYHDRMPLVLDAAAALQWLEVGHAAVDPRSSQVPRVKLRHNPLSPMSGQLSLF